MLLSAPILKFNDYQKKQERNILVSNKGVYNLKGNSNHNFMQQSNEK